MDERERINELLRERAPAVWQSLSELGRRAVYPRDIPFQAAEARGKRYNATIGQITDRDGRVLALEPIREALSGLPDADREVALRYAPMAGLPELRRRWREWERPRDAAASSLPIVTDGLTHGLALIADLFAGPERNVVLPSPFWGNYRQVFGLRTGARLLEVPVFADRRFAPTAPADALSELPEGEPALVVVNAPSNPTGYSPTPVERDALIESLVEASSRRPLVVLCDDAYAGLVYDDDVPARSLFWDLIGRSDGLVPLRVSGATKELTYFGGRVGFVTLPFAPDSDEAEAIESKMQCLLRAGVGSSVASSQAVVLQALRSESLVRETAAVVTTMAERWRVLQAALARADAELVRPLPCNAGVFTVLELPEGVDAEALRRHLLEQEETGLVSIPPRHVRIAFCSVEADDLPEVVRRLERGIRALRDR